MLYEILATISDTVGLVGVTFLLTAFFLLSTDRISSKALKYQLLNLCGAILIMYSLLFHWNTASVVIEASWITISLIGIFRTMRARKVVKTVALNQPISNIYHIGQARSS